MSSMEIDRRRFLTGAAVLLAGSNVQRVAYGSDTPLRYVTSLRDGDGRFHVAVLTEAGDIARMLAIDERGHDVAISPDQTTAVAFARRPGTFAVSIDLSYRHPPQIFRAPLGRHFYGHGCYAPDGRLLYATENDYEAARGVLGVYDTGAGYHRIGELDTHGVGPHEVLLLDDGSTLCVANGGIETHPDSGRAMLNLDSMSPSLTFIDRKTGDLKARHVLPKTLHKLSLRHLSLDQTGNVWFGGQWEGATESTPSLVGCAGLDTDARVCETPSITGASLKGYIGSMASSADGSIIAASAPRAGTVVYFDARSATVIGQSKLRDVCGIAPARQGTFARSSGEGQFEVSAPGATAGHERRHGGLSFDNHLRRIG